MRMLQRVGLIGAGVLAVAAGVWAYSPHGPTPTRARAPTPHPARPGPTRPRTAPGSGPPPGSVAWARAIPAAFQAATGLKPPGPFWVVRDPADPTTWWALDPTAQAGALWAGIATHGRWAWQGVDVQTGAYVRPGGPVWPNALSVSVGLGLDLARGVTTPAASAYNAGVHPWNDVTGQVGPPVGWTAVPAGAGAVQVTVYVPYRRYGGQAAFGVTTVWTRTIMQTGRGYFATLTAEPNQPGTWQPTTTTQGLGGPP
ncbi:MAG: hypothetical protein K6V97_11135 [Actinomycetia bacterium]|nr:hypothetical protein [Actinomycetes bacterium]